MAVLFVNNLTNVDFSYLHESRGMIGESWLVDIEIEGEQDEQGMIVDFAVVKQVVRSTVDEVLDHKLLVPSQSPCLSGMEATAAGHNAWLWNFGDLKIEIEAPEPAISLLPLGEIDTAPVADHIKTLLKERLPGDIQRLELVFHPEAIEGSYYHYSHGLKKHNGPCQRIAHGHRSRIEVSVGTARNKAMEDNIARDFRDIYIGTREDLRSTVSIDGEDYNEFAYTSAEGNSRLLIPARCCHLIDTDSTVENIASHLLSRLLTEHGGPGIAVKAFEGITKGSIAST